MLTFHRPSALRAVVLLCAALVAGAWGCREISEPCETATFTITPNPLIIAANTTQQFTATARNYRGEVISTSAAWSVVAGGGTVNSGSGLFTAGARADTFPNTILATSNGWTAHATVIVTGSVGPLATIAVTPNPATVVVGGTQQFVATGHDAQGNVVTITPTWSVVASGGAINSSGLSAGLFTAGTVTGTFTNTVRATSGAISGLATVIVSANPPGPLATITVTPDPATMVVGGTQLFVATGRDADGNVVTITPTWSVVASGGAVSSAGLFTAGAVTGTFTNTVRAASGAISGLATVIVTANPPGPLATITVTPNPATVEVSGTQLFVATGRDADGNVVTITPTWSVVASGGAINSSGLSAGLFTAGTVTGTFTNTVRAASGAISGFATVNVTAGPLATIAVTPNPATVEVSGTQQFVATGHDSHGNVVTITPTWSVVASGGAINSSGLFTAGTVTGTFTNTVRAASGAISGLATVIVSANPPGPLATITVTPNPATVEVSGTQLFVATGRDADGNVVTITPTWSVVASGGAINGSGLFTAGTVTGTFTNTVRATSGAISGFATVNVIAGTLATITVTPNPATVIVSGTQQFVATGHDAHGNVVTITPTWSVVADGGAINSSGLFTAGTVTGTFTNTVRATSSAISGFATVIVTAGPLATITVTPNPATLLISETQQFVATGHDAHGNVVTITPTWSVVASGGTINSSGLFTAGTVTGTFTNTVRATSSSVSGFATVIVNASPPGPLATITVTPNPATVVVGGTQQFVATGRDADGNVVTITPTWSVVASGGTINSSGLFTAGTVTGTFTTTVRATSGAISGFATVNVIAGTLATITVTPNPATVIVSGTQLFVATGRDAHGNVVTITPTWSVVASGGAINGSGLFTAGTVTGTFTNTVRATSGAISGFATVNVIAGTLATITVTPNPATVIVSGTQLFVATGRDAHGNVVTITPTWSVVASGGAINGSGLFTAGTVTGTFTNTVRATSGAISGFATVNVIAGTLATITVTPNPATLLVSGTQLFVATGRDAHGNVVTITPTWSVVASGGAINGSGLFTAGTVTGTFTNTVRATSGAISGFATVNVIAGTLATITVTPNPATLLVSGTQLFVATGRDAHGNVVTITPTWSVVASGGAINGSGLFTAGTVTGTFTNTVRAMSGAISGFATVIVIAGPLATITVTPNPATVEVSETQQFIATGRDAHGNLVTITPTWSIVASGGTINGAGLFTAGTGAGTFTNTVRARSGAISGFATVIVTSVSPPATLGSAATFAVLGGSTVTNTGVTTTIVGDVGVSPGTAIVGIPEGQPTEGSIHAGDGVAAAAQADLTTAYNDLAGRACGTNLTSQDLGGMTLAPGVYCFNTSAGLTGTLTFDAVGDPNAVFVIQIGSTLTTASTSAVDLIRGADANNVYWQVGSSATLGTGTAFKGNIIAIASVTLNTGASLSGRALARTGAVTLDTNAVSLP